jgi:hypothetical protein
MQRITVVLEYDDDKPLPMFCRHMCVQINGTFGEVVAVAFEDTFAEREKELE